jgi:hypothetical protein
VKNNERLIKIRQIESISNSMFNLKRFLDFSFLTGSKDYVTKKDMIRII